MNAAELLVKALEAEGVECVFGLPGEENLAFVDALQNHPGIRTILVRHEQAGGFMAAASAPALRTWLPPRPMPISEAGRCCLSQARSPFGRTGRASTSYLT